MSAIVTAKISSWCGVLVGAFFVRRIFACIAATEMASMSRRGMGWRFRFEYGSLERRNKRPLLVEASIMVF